MTDALPEQYYLPSVAAEAPVIDGHLDDWDPEHTFVVEITPETRPPQDHYVTPSNPFEGSDDLSATVMMSWDDDYLYIGGKVHDDYLRGIAPGTGHDEGPDGWGSDGLMLNLRSYRQPINRTGPHDLLAFRYTVPKDGRGAVAKFRDHPDRRWKLTPGSLLAFIETDEGYQLEGAIPWADLNFEPALGEPLHIGIMLVDVDPDQPLKQLGWHHNNPQPFRLTDEPKPDTVALLSVAQNSYAPGVEPQGVMFQVDALHADVLIEAVRLKGPADLEQKVEINETVPVGRRGEGLVFFENIPEAIGSAKLYLDTVTKGQRTVQASGAFEIATATARERPMVSTPAGELIRYAPERTVHNAEENRRRKQINYNYINSRDGYERWIFEYVKSVVDSLDGTIEKDYLRPDGNRGASNLILRALVLYRLTGEKRYAEWTKILVESQLRYLEHNAAKGIYHSRLSSLIWPRHFIWQHDPDTHLAPPDAEERFAAIWASYAANPPELLFSEWGYHNRTWHRWRDLNLIAHFAEEMGMPIDPRVHEYLEWHDEHLVPFADSTDNSSGYNWLGLLYFIETHAAMGRLDEIKENDAFWKVAARLRDYFSPAGIMPNWGDTSGWMTGNEHISTLELLASLSGDGHYRYVAHRIAEYFYNSLWDNPNQYHGPADRVHNTFAKAWLSANEDVMPNAPDGNSEILFKPQTTVTTTEARQARPGLSPQGMSEMMVPDKAILKSGNDPYGLWALIELLDLGGHAGILPGNVAMVLNKSAALYAGQGYWDTDQGDNNVMWVEDLEGTAAVAERMRTEVPDFVDDRALTWVRVRSLRYGNLPITGTRDILFVKNGFIVVRDHLKFHAMMKLRMGPTWHTRNLGPQCGDDWFNTYYDKLYHTGLGVGRGVQTIANPPWDMMIAYAPREDTEVSVDDRYDENPWRVSPVRIRQSWSGFVIPGDTRTFVTVLLPHKPALDVKPFRQNLEFLVNSQDSLLLRVPNYNNARNPLGGNVFTLQFQDGEGSIDAADWSSDAMIALVERRQDGSFVQAVMLNGTNLTDRGENLADKARALETKPIFLLDE